MRKLTLALTLIGMCAFASVPSLQAQINNGPTPTLTTNPSGSPTEILQEAKAGEFRVAVGSIAAGLPLGNNRIDISLFDSNNKPVADATLRVRLAPVDRPETGNWAQARGDHHGKYATTLKATAAGNYVLQVSVSHHGDTAGVATFNVKAGNGATPPVR